MRQRNIFVLFSLSRGGIGVDQLLFQFLISQSVAKILVVESKKLFEIARNIDFGWE